LQYIHVYINSRFLLVLSYIAEIVVMCLLRLNDLVARFEAPDSRNRWDSPIFTVHAADPLPFDQVHQVLYHRLPAPPNLSTLPVSTKHLLQMNIYRSCYWCTQSNWSHMPVCISLVGLWGHFFYRSKSL